jgi:hypothetical protein
MLLAAWMILMRILPGSLMRPCPACAVMRRRRLCPGGGQKAPRHGTLAQGALPRRRKKAPRHGILAPRAMPRRRKKAPLHGILAQGALPSRRKKAPLHGIWTQRAQRLARARGNVSPPRAIAPLNQTTFQLATKVPPLAITFKKAIPSYGHLTTISQNHLANPFTKANS